jgi:glycosyltransferase involved in cell wall biosynthesis
MEIKNAVCYSFPMGSQDAMAHLRLIAPLKQAGIQIINGIENGQPVAESVLDGNIVVIQRDFPQKFDDYQRVIKIARRERKPIVFDLDDLLLFLPEDHPDRLTQYYAPALLPMFQALMEADLVTVSTPKLQSVLANFNDHIAVLPNFFDDTLWQLRQPVLKSKGEILTIGYMGGNPHRPDIEYIKPVVLDLINRYPHKVRFHFWGVQPPAEIFPLPQVEWTPPYSYLYKDFSAFFQTQSADIFISPLIDNLFNRCKSPLKFFEYTALGAPGIYSNLEAYTDVVSHGKNGLLAASLDEWTDCLIQLIENDELRLQLATVAQATIRDNWLLSQNAFHWGETFQSAFEIMNSNRKQDTPIVSTLRAINLQSIETYNAFAAQVAEKDQSLQALKGLMAEKNQSILALTGQVAEKDQSLQALTGQMAEKNQSILALTGQVTEKDQSIQALSKQEALKEYELSEIYRSKAWRLAMRMRRIRVWLAPPGGWRSRLFSFALIPSKIRRDRRIKRNLNLIRASNLFDESWYLANYLDVAQSGLDPTLHYLLFGGFEGRNPCRDFSSKSYLEAYPDVKAAGINPLIHYLKYGEAEGRVAFSPDKGSTTKRIFGKGKKQKRDSLARIIIENTLVGFYKFYLRLPLDEQFRQKIQRFSYKLLPIVSQYKQAVNQITSKRRSRLENSSYNSEFFPGENLSSGEDTGSNLAICASLIGMDESSLESLLVSCPWQVEDLEWSIDKHPQSEQAEEAVLSPTLFTIILFVNDPPAHFLNDCIISVQKQNFKNWQMEIYVKEGSLWDADVLAEQLASRDSRIHIRSTRFSSGAVVEFKGSVQDSAGEYIIFLNPIDVLKPDALRHAADKIGTSGCDLIYCPDDLSSDLTNKGISEDKNQPEDRSYGEFAFSQFAVWRKTYLLSLLPDRSNSFVEDLNNIKIEFGDAGKPRLVKTLKSSCYVFRQIPGRIKITITDTKGNLDLTVSSIPLRILVDARLINRQVTGTERYILELLKALSLLRKEYDLDLKAIALSQPKEKIEGVDFITTKHIEAIRNSHVFHKTFPASDGPTLAEMALAPSVVFTPLDMILYSNPDYFLTEKDYHYYCKVMQLAANLSDRIISISNHGKSDIERLLHFSGKLINTIYLGVHPERFSPDKQEGGDKLARLKVPSNYFLFVGTDYPHKNLITLLRAFQLARQHIPESHLVLVGTKYHLYPQPKLDELMKKMAGHILNFGHVPDDVLPALYHNAIALVYPSLYEGFGLPILEAMLCRTPVIASDSTSIPEVSGEAAILVDGRDKNQIADAMMKVWDDPELRSRMVLAGHQNAAKFSWESTASQTVKCYQEAINDVIFTSPKIRIIERLKILNGFRIPPPTILIVTHIRFYPPAAGNEQRLFRLVKYLKELGYRIIMLVNPFMESTQIDRESRNSLHHYVDYYEEIGDVTADGTNSAPLESEIGNESILEKWKSTEASFCSNAVMDRVRHLMEQFSPKIMLAEYIWMTRIFTLATPGTLRVIDAHDMFSRKNENVTKFGIQDTLAITPSEELAFINRSNVVIAIQDIEAAAFRKLAPSCRVITAGVDFDVDQLPESVSLDLQSPILLIIGSGNHINVSCVNEFLDQAWPAIKQKTPLCKLKIVGKVCNQLKTNDQNVELIPYSSDLGSTYKTATVVINPVYAGTGLKVKSVEALGHGKALVCWPEGAMGIPQKHLEPFKITHSWGELAGSVIELIANPDKRNELEKAAREFAKSTLSSKVVYKQVVDCFDTFCKRELNVLCLFLRYGTKDYPESLVDLQKWYEKKMPGTKVTIWIIDNNIKNEFDGIDLRTGYRLLSGNNTEREFSAFQKILIEQHNEIGSYDVIHFVTSAFNTLFTGYLDYFSRDLLELVAHRPLCLGHIDAYDEPIKIANETSQSWVRTCFFFMSPETACSIPDFVSFRDESQFFDDAGNFLAKSGLSENYQKYIIDWLRGETMQGVIWHKRTLDPKAFQEKVMTILNEHMLSIRLTKAGIDLADIYWAKEKCQELIKSIEYAIPNRMEQVKFRQAGLFGTIAK